MTQRARGFEGGAAPRRRRFPWDFAFSAAWRPAVAISSESSPPAAPPRAPSPSDEARGRGWHACHPMAARAAAAAARRRRQRMWAARTRKRAFRLRGSARRELALSPRATHRGGCQMAALMGLGAMRVTGCACRGGSARKGGGKGGTRALLSFLGSLLLFVPRRVAVSWVPPRAKRPRPQQPTIADARVCGRRSCSGRVARERARGVGLVPQLAANKQREEGALAGAPRPHSHTYHYCWHPTRYTRENSGRMSTRRARSRGRLFGAERVFDGTCPAAPVAEAGTCFRV